METSKLTECRKIVIATFGAIVYIRELKEHVTNNRGSVEFVL